MKKKIFIMIWLLALVHVTYFEAATSYFRTPLSFIESRWGTVHYPLPWLDDDYSNDGCGCDWEVDALGVLYERSACCAFGQNQECCVTNNSCNDCDDKVTRNCVSLSQLWFGQSSFLADAIFAG